MSENSVVIQGMVRSDGTLELEGKVPLPAGKVRVTVQPLANEQRAAEFLAFVRKIQAIREGHGVKPDAKAALAAARKLRDEFNEQIEELGRLQDDCRRRRLETEDALIVSLDANVVIDLIEMDPVWEPKVATRLAALVAAGEEIAVCDALQLECLLKPLATGDAGAEAAFRAFFARVRMLPVSTATWERAAQIRATFHFKAMDSLHLATAVEHGCGLFLTADSRLGRCTAIPVEVLK